MWIYVKLFVEKKLVGVGGSGSGAGDGSRRRSPSWMAGVNVNKSDSEGLDRNSNSNSKFQGACRYSWVVECWVETKRNTCFDFLKHVQLKRKRNTYIETAPIFSHTWNKKTKITVLKRTVLVNSGLTFGDIAALYNNCKPTFNVGHKLPFSHAIVRQKLGYSYVISRIWCPMSCLFQIDVTYNSLDVI